MQSTLSCLVPFKQNPSLVGFANTLIFFVSFAQICIAYFLSGHKGPKTNSPSLSVNVCPTGLLSFFTSSHTISTNLTAAFFTGSLKQFFTVP